ncbi:hypothetical protein RFN57_25815 [Streptomyces violaceochromogenes]|uniref:Secreted protein n=1 Tax=Streptomyces violaceochromogenes TaxID=67377 RepID=A0ABU6M4A9_9ACTN|nr:hypothetical protein [Streptomyces violaceochromogenes]MEC7055672.1 hypothetical protein [Streptomyces violaceochromogenes]GHC74431.1 hypothetical protein GCM10010309_45360 [Streptomyces violaceochromogenes]
MPKKRPLAAQEHTDGAPSSVLRRALLGGLVLAVLLAVAGLLAYLTRADSPAPAKPAPTPASTQRAASPTTTPGERTAVATPPKTSDPIVFAKAATKVLWTYDTRSFSRAEHVAGLKRWMTGEKKYADWESVSDQIPSPVLWSRMHDNRQHATAKVGEGHFPQVFKTALAQDPGAITEAYVYAVTVTGKQSIAWKGAGSGAESRSTTLAVQCRPDKACALVGVLPSVAP